MVNLKKIIKITFSILLIITAQGKESVYNKIAQDHMSSFKPIIEKNIILNSINPQTGKIDKEKIQKHITENFTIPRNYTEITLALFNQSSPTKNFITQPNLTKTSKKLFKNLEILCGEHLPSSHLLSKIDRTLSYSGRMTLACMLMQPTNDTQELKRRQSIIRELIENEKAFNKLNKTLSEYKKLEQHLLNFFSEKTFNKLFGSENYFPQTIWQLSFLLDILPQNFINKLEIDKFTTEVNKNSTLLALFSILNLKTKGSALKKHITNDLKIHMKSAYKEINENKMSNVFLIILQTLFGSFGEGKYFVSKSFEDLRTIYLEIKQEKKNYKQLKVAYKNLRQISKTIANIQNIEKIINKNPKLNNQITSINNIEYLFKKTSCGSLDFDKTLNNLKSKIFQTFKTKNTSFLYLYALKGIVLSSAYIMASQQMYLIDFIKPFGEIDAYMSIAKLYKESINSKAKYCFANYQDSKNSHVKMTNFWTPFIDPETVVTNNIELGGNKNEKCALISGPNAGGKSTILKSIILNTLLAQTITIAAAQKCILTPFSYIDTYLNITDDISGGNSLFKSEVLRVKDLLKNIENNGKSLIIVDEMFSGTNPREGQAASYAIAEHIAQLANEKEQIIALMASHYSEMTNLEQNTLGIFKNYKITANIDENSHKLEYPFKLQFGKSDQAVAIDILQSEGLNSKIINSAKKIASRNELI
jgi:DNA mismatch repair protein MutS